MTHHTFPFKAAVFDMDGLMVDTEPLNSKALETTIKEYRKTPIYQENGLVQEVGVSSDENIRRILKKQCIDEDFQVFSNKRRAIYRLLLEQHLSPMPGLSKLLKLLKDNGIKIAVASSSRMDHILYITKNIGAQKYFDAFVSGREVPRTKPFPDVYVEAARKLNVDPKDCIAFEDSETGVQAATDAGIKVIAVPSTYTKHHNFQKAYKKISSLTEATPEFLASL